MTLSLDILLRKEVSANDDDGKSFSEGICVVSKEATLLRKETS